MTQTPQLPVGSRRVVDSSCSVSLLFFPFLIGSLPQLVLDYAAFVLHTSKEYLSSHLRKLTENKTTAIMMMKSIKLLASFLLVKECAVLSFSLNSLSSSGVRTSSRHSGESSIAFAPRDESALRRSMVSFPQDDVPGVEEAAGAANEFNADAAEKKEKKELSLSSVVPLLQAGVLTMAAVGVAYSLVTAALTGTANIVSSGVTALGTEVVKETGHAIVVVGGAAFEGAKVAVPFIGKAVVGGVKAAAPVVGAASQKVSEFAAPIVEDAARQFSEAATPIMQDAARQITEAATPYVESVSNAVDESIVTPITTSVGEVVSPVTNAVDSAVNGVSDSASGVVDSVRNTLHVDIF